MGKSKGYSRWYQHLPLCFPINSDKSFSSIKMVPKTSYKRFANKRTCILSRSFKHQVCTDFPHSIYTQTFLMNAIPPFSRLQVWMLSRYDATTRFHLCIRQRTVAVSTKTSNFHIQIHFNGTIQRVFLNPNSTERNGETFLQALPPPPCTTQLNM